MAQREDDVEIQRQTRRMLCEEGGLGRRIQKPKNTRTAGKALEASRARDTSPPEPSEGARPCQHLDFRLLASQVPREVSAGLTHPVCGTRAGQPQETNTLPLATFKTKVSWQCEPTDNHPNGRRGVASVYQNTEKRIWEL